MTADNPTDSGERHRVRRKRSKSSRGTKRMTAESFISSLQKHPTLTTIVLVAFFAGMAAYMAVKMAD